MKCYILAYAGQPAYEMLETDPDWAPSLHLGHMDTVCTDTARSARIGKRDELKTQQQVRTQEAGHHHPSEEDTQEAVDGSQAHHEEGTQDNSEEAQEPECHMCSLRSAEVNRLLDENRELRRELQKYRMSEDFSKIMMIK